MNLARESAMPAAAKAIATRRQRIEFGIWRSEADFLKSISIQLHAICISPDWKQGKKQRLFIMVTDNQLTLSANLLIRQYTLQNTHLSTAKRKRQKKLKEKKKIQNPLI